MKRAGVILVAVAIMVLVDKYAIALFTGIAVFGLWGRIDHG